MQVQVQDCTLAYLQCTPFITYVFHLVFAYLVYRVYERGTLGGSIPLLYPLYISLPPHVCVYPKHQSHQPH